MTKHKGKRIFRRYKFYRRYVTDLWGSLTRRRKVNSTLKMLIDRLTPVVKRKIRKLPSRSLRKKMYIKFAIPKRYFNPNRIFNLTLVSKESRKLRIKRLRYRGLLLAMKKKLRVYYGLKIKRKKLRKLTFLVKIKTNRYFSRILESRFDSLLLRSNFVDTIGEAREIIKTGRAKILIPRAKSTLSWFYLKNPGHRVSLYTPIELINKLKIKRKNSLIKNILSNRLVSYPPNYLFVNFVLMHSFTTAKLSDDKVKYTFPGNLNYFTGLSKYL